MLRHKNNESRLCRGSNKAKYQGNNSRICVSMKIDNMLHCDRFGVQKCRFLGPSRGPFLLFWAPRAAKSRTSRTATPFLLICERGQKLHIFEEVERSIKNRFFGPKRPQETNITPRGFVEGAAEVSDLAGWSLGLASRARG